MLSRHWDAVGFCAHCRHCRDGDRAGWQSHLCRYVISEAVRAGNDLLQAAILGMQAVGFPFPDGCSVQDGVAVLFNRLPHFERTWRESYWRCWR